ncbi:cobalt-precorrin-5B (C(1))-methyltransferase [Archaeoglobus neptunius]|uniref:cobalt-precorrin-5B (C(1))-methyltransferase n=1 Tax=Archaeoglobus neptunius TaxID=2798580 RepID=UPI001927DE9A|nr:cobalt-precorrin-5B (C(1))-methyltransferase [Archaeoglobus neptunius]
MLRDPIELYEYPREWHNCDEEIVRKVKSGLYILTEDGFLRRGITTGTTASAAVVAAISSLYEDVKKVKITTPAGIPVDVKVEVAGGGFARVRKFSGDHEFDVTDGLVIEAEVTDGRGVKFGEGVGEFVRGEIKRKAVSKSALMQIQENFLSCSRKYGFTGGVMVSIPEGRKIAMKTGNKRAGVEGGISILGTTGFVEPWCRRLVETKLKIAMQYEKITITTGRKAWLYSIRKFPEYQPFVFGVHIDEALEHPGEKVVVGFPGILSIWAGGRDKIWEKCKKAGVRVEVIGDDLDNWIWNMQKAGN